MRTSAIVVLAFVLFRSEGIARLGETEDELAIRFGAPTSRMPEKMFTQGKSREIGTRLRFREGDWTIESSIIDGRCAREVYSKVGEWTEEQFSTVLNSNAQGVKWKLTSKESMRKVIREWRREDGATAIWKAGALTVTHPAFDRAKALAEAKAKADAARAPKI
jgi:hypothetical protein